MGIRAGICKVQKERQVTGAAPQRAGRRVNHSKRREVMLGDRKGETVGWETSQV